MANSIDWRNGLKDGMWLDMPPMPRRWEKYLIESEEKHNGESE